MRIRFGILGTGLIASTHAAALASLSDAVLVGCSDADFSRAEAFAAAHHIRAYRSDAEMLSDEGIDAVCICTPSGYHTGHALNCLAHQKHVVLEKPMAFDVSAADRIIAACREHDRKLTVISQTRFAPDVIRVRELVGAGAFGTLSMCSLYMKYWREPSYYAASAWRGTKQYDGGGALMNQGVHGVDLLRYIAGDMTVTAAQARTRTHDIEVEDTANALLSFENGAVGVIEASTCAYPGFARQLELIGDRGHAIIRDTSLESLVIDGKEIPCENAVHTVEAANKPSVSDCTLHARQISNFIDAVMRGTPLESDASEGKKAIEIIERVYALAGI